MVVFFSCGLFRYDLGGSSSSEPPECDGEGEVEADEEEWSAGSVSTECPACGETLWQEGDHFHVKGLTVQPLGVE